jgi:hypothetical protein
MSKPPQKLSRSEALHKIDAFISDLDAGWERDGTAWGKGLLTILQQFRYAATCAAPDLQRLSQLRVELEQFMSGHKILKGFSPLLAWVDTIVESYGPVV